jgi:selenocysteine lyase/cysteine desulfurase
MNSLYEQARQVVAEELGADPADYAVIFTGSGSTGGLDKLARALLPGDGRRAGLSCWRKPLPPVVFVGPYEHHSNEVLWRERECLVVVSGPCSRLAASAVLRLPCCAVLFDTAAR